MTSTRRERRVTYYLPGTFFAEDTTRRIGDGPDIVQRAAAGAPAGAFCFVLSTVLAADPVPDGEGGTLRVQPKTVETTGRYYLGGDILDRDGVAALDGDHRILLSNMDGNGWPRVVRTRFGNFQPFEAGDVVLPAEPVLDGPGGDRGTPPGPGAPSAGRGSTVSDLTRGVPAGSGPGGDQ